MVALSFIVFFLCFVFVHKYQDDCSAMGQTNCEQIHLLGSYQQLTLTDIIVIWGWSFRLINSTISNKLIKIIVFSYKQHLFNVEYIENE